MMLSESSPQPLFTANNRSYNSPSSLLNSSSDTLNYILQYNFKEPNDASVLEGLTTLKIEALHDEPKTTSQLFQDYFIVQPEIALKMEEAGAGNSLFLAIARALLYKLYYRDHNFEPTMRSVYFSDIDLIASFKFDSDLALQEVIRKKLCLFWLSSLKAQNSLNHTKYKFDFQNIYDFVYQVYQIGINNFSYNRLFVLHALQDLSVILNHKIYVFKKNASNLECICHVYKPNETTCDSIFLLYNEAAQVKFKWLMPNYSRAFIQSNLLKTEKTRELSFLKVNWLYQNRMLVVNTSEFNYCFGDQIYKDLNILLFMTFLVECPAHLLVSIHNLEFSTVKTSQDMVDYLNTVWGQNYFSLKEAKIRMEYLIYKRSQDKPCNEATNQAQNTNLEANANKESYETQKFKVQREAGRIRTPKVTALIGGSHNLPPISPNFKRKPSKNSPVNSQTPKIVQTFQPKKFLSPQTNQIQKTTTNNIVTSFKQHVSTADYSQQESPAENVLKPTFRKKQIITELTTSRRKSCHGVILCSTDDRNEITTL